jgi:23S rRNA pseudouridine1911/1915/1917 synthase
VEPSQDPSQSDLPVLVVEADEAGLRLDGFLARRKIVPSVAAARRALAAGIVAVNGRSASKGTHVQTGDVVALGDEPASDVILKPSPELELTVLYLDDEIVAVDKPAGIASHPIRPCEGATVASGLIARFPECAGASPDPREGGLGHRLDVSTSGVLLAARSREAWYRLHEALATPFCEKIYFAETRGDFPAAANIEHASVEFVVPGGQPSSFVITVPIGRQGRRGHKVKLASGRQPLAARTEITLVESRPGAALVEARLSRGRAHQVRAHLAYLGIPVIGDAVYGQVDQDANMDLHLHAWAVSFVHPTTGKPLRIEAPLPTWARRLF